MAEFKSQNEISNRRTTNFFKPGLAGLILYLLLSGILLIAANAGNINEHLGSNVSSQLQLKANFSNFTSGFDSSFSTVLGGRLGQIIVWSSVGAAAYVALWLLRNILNSFENDIISAHYLHPSNYSGAGYWASSLAMKVFLGGMTILTVVYFFIVIETLLPTLAAMASSAYNHFELRSSITYMAFSWLGMALALYVGVVLLRLTAHLWKRL